MKTNQTIFIFGKDPGPDTSYRDVFKHPKGNGADVRFVKHAGNNTLYFNLYDFISPFKNEKYINTIKSILPRGRKNLKEVWMNTIAWLEIKKGIDNNKEEDIIRDWKEQELF